MNLILIGVCSAVYGMGGIFAATSAYPYLKTGREGEEVLGIERVGAFVFWWLVLPAAAIRCVWETIHAFVEWLFTKS